MSSFQFRLPPPPPTTVMSYFNSMLLQSASSSTFCICRVFPSIGMIQGLVVPEPCFLAMDTYINVFPDIPRCFPANTTLFYPFFPIIVRQPVEVSRFSKFGKISNPDVRQPVNVSIVFNNFLTGPNIVRSPVYVSRFRVKSEKMLPLVRKLSINL